MCGVVVWKMTLKTVRFTGTAFMQSTSRSRLTFKRLLLLMSGVTIGPFPMIDRGYCLGMIGVDPAKYSGHSFRRGGATFAHRLGVDPLLIKRMGDWRSDAYRRYIDHNTPEGGPGPPAANPRSGLLRLRVSAKVCGAWAAQAG